MNVESLRKVLRSASSKSALTGSPPEPVPWDTRLLDVNLLQHGDDQEYIDVESAFFANHRDEGDFLLWPMNGVMPADMARGCLRAGLREAACPVVTRQPRDVPNVTIRENLASTFPTW